VHEQWEHRVELFGMEWRRQHRLPDAEGLQRKLTEWGLEGWQLVAFELVRDEHRTSGEAATDPDSSPTAAYLAILKRLREP
jgi:hypothetical protein